MMAAHRLASGWLVVSMLASSACGAEPDPEHAKTAEQALRSLNERVLIFLGIGLAGVLA